MRDVVVIGGGLSGLAAAYELEQHKVDYTLIEVKRQLGGSIHTIEQDGFTLDMGVMSLADNLDASWLESLGLGSALFKLSHGVAFQDGTRSLVQAIDSRLAAPKLMRMAVSSIGELENGRCSICLENGIMLDAGALIIALPARYAQRVFYGYITELTEQLLDYEYDSVYRVSLGYRTADIPEHIRNPIDMSFVYIHRTEHPARVPDGHTLLQIGMRFAPQAIKSLEQVVNVICHRLNLPQPVTAAMGYWPDADPLSCYHDHHADWLKNLREKLPGRVALIGSDYLHNPPSRRGFAHFQERITQGREAAQQMMKLI